MKYIACIPFLFICFLGHAQHNAFKVEVIGKGQPVILIPGYSCSGEVWKETVDHLKNRYSCHVITLSGFGNKDAIDTPMLRTAKDQLVGYIKKNNLQHVILIGHSLGAFMSSWVNSEVPDRIDKMICVDGLPAIVAMFDEHINIDSLSKSPAYNLPAVVKNFENLPDSNYVKTTAEALKYQVNDSSRALEIAGWSFASNRKALAYGIVEISLTDLRPLLYKIKSPTLIIASLYNGSKELSEKVMHAQYSNLANKKIVVAQSKHFIMYDVPAWFYAQLDAFLNN